MHLDITDKNTQRDQTYKKTALRVSTVSIAVNIALSLLKLLAGIIASSTAMISDAVHSASDVFSTLVVIIGVHISSKNPDRDHPYGHERLECVASALLAVILAATGIGIGWKGIESIVSASSEPPEIPGALALAAAAISIVVKEIMYRYTKSAARKLDSGALMADAWHHRSDALSSVGALVGIAGARLGLPIMDPIASVVICIFIGKAAVDIFRDAVNKMVDKACPEETIDKMHEVIMSVDGVIGIDELKTRLFGSKIFVEVEIRMAASKTLVEAHEAAEQVHAAIEREFSAVKHCMVHVNPDLPDKKTMDEQLDNAGIPPS